MCTENLICFLCVINSVQISHFCISSSVIWEVHSIGHHNAPFSCCETSEFLTFILHFLFFKPTSKSTVFLRISLIVTNKLANCLLSNKCCVSSSPAQDTSAILVYTGCPRRNVPNFGRVFLMLNYTDITQNTYIQS